jgi:transcription elongation factor GreB
MGRWRPPSEKGSAYITAAGFKRMKDEVTQLWKVERPQVTQVVHEAAKNGDRSENGDYQQSPHTSYYFHCSPMIAVTSR